MKKFFNKSKLTFSDIITLFAYSFILIAGVLFSIFLFTHLDLFPALFMFFLGWGVFLLLFSGLWGLYE